MAWYYALVLQCHGTTPLNDYALILNNMPWYYAMVLLCHGTTPLNDYALAGGACLAANYDGAEKEEQLGRSPALVTQLPPSGPTVCSTAFNPRDSSGPTVCNTAFNSRDTSGPKAISGRKINNLGICCTLPPPVVATSLLEWSDIGQDGAVADGVCTRRRHDRAAVTRAQVYRLFQIFTQRQPSAKKRDS
jgi:hypothetical protein